MGLLKKKQRIVGIVILVKVFPSYESKVYRELEKIEEINELYPVFGDYDFVVIIYTEPQQDLPGFYHDMMNFVVFKIRTIEGVVDTNTLNYPRI